MGKEKSVMIINRTKKKFSETGKKKNTGTQYMTFNKIVS